MRKGLDPRSKTRLGGRSPNFLLPRISLAGPVFALHSLSTTFDNTSTEANKFDFSFRPESCHRNTNHILRFSLDCFCEWSGSIISFDLFAGKSAPQLGNSVKAFCIIFLLVSPRLKQSERNIHIFSNK